MWRLLASENTKDIVGHKMSSDFRTDFLIKSIYINLYVP